MSKKNKKNVLETRREKRAKLDDSLKDQNLIQNLNYSKEKDSVSSQSTISSKKLTFSNEDLNPYFLHALKTSLSQNDLDRLKNISKAWVILEEYYLETNKIMPQILNFSSTRDLCRIDQKSLLSLLDLEYFKNCEIREGFLYKIISINYYAVAEKILKEGRVEHQIREECLYEFVSKQDLVNFCFLLKYIDDKNFIAKHSKEIFTSATKLMNDEQFSYFKPKFIKFITEELIKSLGEKDALKEGIRASIYFGGYHCTVYDFLDAVLSAFPTLKDKVSSEELLKELEKEETCYLDETDNGDFILHEENTEKCLGEILAKANIDNYCY